MNADRNLLFGILALQMDFITRDQLITAMQAWVLEKSKPLGRILLDQGALSAPDQALLDTVVQRHLERHGHDARQSLAALSAVSSSVRQELGQVADGDVQASIVHLPPSDPDRTKQEPPGACDSGRFRILRPHAKGGLGEVFVAKDTELQREIALKEIQGQHAYHPHSRARFLLEAEITGGLEHPGIVPVYSLGHYPDGRPYYAMRFIRGDSLQHAIERFHASRERVNASRERQRPDEAPATPNPVAGAPGSHPGARGFESLEFRGYCPSRCAHSFLRQAPA